MTDEKNDLATHCVEVWFRIEKDSDGCPKSKEWEQLLAECTVNGLEFRLLSIPFFLKNVSRGDIVKVKQVQSGSGDYYEFESVVRHAGHNTYRLLLQSKDSQDVIVSELIAKGLGVESNSGGLLAVDVPPEADQDAVDRFLVEQSECRRWQMQDGHLCSIEVGTPPVNE